MLQRRVHGDVARKISEQAEQYQESGKKSAVAVR